LGDKKVGVFVRFRAPLHKDYLILSSYINVHLSAQIWLHSLLKATGQNAYRGVSMLWEAWLGFLYFLEQLLFKRVNGGVINCKLNNTPAAECTQDTSTQIQQGGGIVI
jgi:hypothetical protein